MFRIRLKELREHFKYSQAVLAEKIGVSQSAVGMWESGRNMPESAKLEALATLFEVSTDYLLGRDMAADAQKEKPVPKDELTDDERELLRLFRQLNAEAQARLLDTADDMVRSGKYAPKNNAAVMAAEEVSQ